MPLYLRKVGSEAEREKREAIDRELLRAKKRAMLSSGRSKELKQANDNMANLRKVRDGIRRPPQPPGDGYSAPVYDPIMRCWKSYVERDGDQDEWQWKAWCTDANQWLSSDEYERSTHSTQDFRPC
jgi:hypothetical protein